MKKAFLTGITGQDGSYLAELLLKKGYEVHGLVRRSSKFAIGAHEGTLYGEMAGSQNLHLYYGDLSDFGSLVSHISRIQPDEVYNLGAMSDVRISFDIPVYTADVTGTGALRLLEAVRQSGKMDTRIYQASTSELFGEPAETPQSETTPFQPRSPYGVAKLFAHWACRNYRETYGMFVASGILFNHESERRGPNFVTAKICRGVADIMLGKPRKIHLGNLDAMRDRGYAPEYVDAMWRMLQQDAPDDYVVATGESHSVREFLEEAFAIAGKPWQDYVEIKEGLFRPGDAEVLRGDITKARTKLGWEPKVKFKELVRILLEAELRNAGKDAAPVSVLMAEKAYGAA